MRRESRSGFLRWKPTRRDVDFFFHILQACRSLFAILPVSSYVMVSFRYRNTFEVCFELMFVCCCAVGDLVELPFPSRSRCLTPCLFALGLSPHALSQGTLCLFPHTALRGPLAAINFHAPLRRHCSSGGWRDFLGAHSTRRRFSSSCRSFTQSCLPADMVSSKDRNPSELCFELTFFYDCAVGSLVELSFPSRIMFDSLHIVLPSAYCLMCCRRTSGVGSHTPPFTPNSRPPTPTSHCNGTGLVPEPVWRGTSPKWRACVCVGCVLGRV